jgi:hypothetical protein
MGSALFCTVQVLQPVCCVDRVWFVAISEELNYTTLFEAMSISRHKSHNFLPGQLPIPVGHRGIQSAPLH